MPLLFLSAPTGAQRIELGAQLGAVVSSPLAIDHIATAPARQLLLGAVDGEVRVEPGTALGAGALARVAFWPRAALEVAVDWSHGQLRVREDGGTREIQRLDVIQATVGAAWQVRDNVYLGAAAGLLRYLTDQRGLFAQGSDTSPLVEASAAWAPPVLDRRAALVVRAQGHRFGAQALRERGANDGIVTRVHVGARVRVAEVGR